MLNTTQKLAIKTMLNDNSSLTLGMTSLKPENFDEGYLQEAFLSIQKSYLNSGRVTEFTTLANLYEKYPQETDEMNDAMMLSNGDFEQGIEKIKKDTRRREAIINLQTALNRLKVSDIDTDETTLNLQQQLTDQVCRESNLGKDLTNKDIAEMMRENARKSKEEKTRNIIPTGFNVLDNSMGGGIDLEEIHIIAAESGGGKTAMIYNILFNIMNQGRKFCLINSEMHDKQVVNRWTAFLTEKRNINYFYSNTEQFADDEIAEVDAGAKIFEQEDNAEPLFWQVSENHLDPNKIKAVVQKYKLMYGVEVFGIDYIGNMDTRVKDRREDQVLRDFMRDLKNIARESRVAFICLAQLTEGQTLQSSRAMKDSLDSLTIINVYKDHEKLESLKSLMIKNGQWKYGEDQDFLFNGVLKFGKARNGEGSAQPIYYNGAKFRFHDYNDTMAIVEGRQKNQEENFNRIMQERKRCEQEKRQEEANNRLLTPAFNDVEENEYPF